MQKALKGDKDVGSVALDAAAFPGALTGLSDGLLFCKLFDRLIPGMDCLIPCAFDI